MATYLLILNNPTPEELYLKQHLISALNIFTNKNYLSDNVEIFKLRDFLVRSFYVIHFFNLQVHSYIQMVKRYKGITCNAWNI